MPSILFLVSSEGYYGVENMLVTLAEQLNQAGHRSVVGVFRNSRFPHIEVAERAEERGIPVEIVECRGRLDRSAVDEVRRLLDKHNVDVLHPHGYKADMYAYAATRRSKRTALVATSHNWPNKQAAMRFYAAIDRLLLGRFDRVVAVSEMVGGVLRRWGVPRRKLSVIFNGVEIERFHGAKPSLRSELPADGASFVGVVGRLVPDKGGALLIEAAEAVLAACPNTRFVFVGEGPARREWEELAAKKGIQDRVTFTGERRDMPGVYASFDMVVLPSLVESMPMCLLEAMAARRPVIATRVGEVPNMVVDGATGLLTDPGDVAGMARAITRLLREPGLGQQFGEQGHRHAVEFFSAQAMAASYTSLYRELVANNGGSRQDAAVLEMSCR